MTLQTEKRKMNETTQGKIDETMDRIQQLEQWYVAQCDGEWEHSYGIKIDTLDNPGWTIKIDLRETNLENRKDFEKRINYRSAKNWMAFKKDGNTFEGAGGPRCLGSMIDFFLEWSKSEVIDIK